MADPRNKPIWRALQIATPAAGVDFTLSPNTSSHWLLWSLRLRFVSDANAANRHMVLTVQNGDTEIFRLTSGSQQAASLDITYSAYPTGRAVTTVGTQGGIGWPEGGLWIPQGYTFQSEIVNLQATDQISEISGLLYEFPTGPETFYWPLRTLIQEESS
jgi:hypothetical protein